MIGKELVYDESLSSLERLYIAIFGVPINGLRIRARRVLPLVMPCCTNILDAGCGQGILTFELARCLPGSVVTGVDINRELLERNIRIAEKIGLTNCRFEFRDIIHLQAASQFDLIVSVDNLEHIENDEQVLRNFYQALTPNGELLLHVPGHERRWLFFKWCVNFDVKGHVRPGYTKEAIEQKVTRAGFRILESYHTYGWLETITNNISYMITKANMHNKHLYALVFPLLLFVSWFGRKSRPVKGAGVLIRAEK